MPVAYELPGSEHGGQQFSAIGDRIEPAPKKADEVSRAVARHPAGLGIDAVKLPLGNIGIVALELLLCPKLDTEIGELALAPLAMLAGAVFALVDRALGAAPDVLPHTAVDLVLGGCTFCHVHSKVSK